ncbi:hypothetical protein [Spirosoma foliorum]|uniref:Uncharacterized protein n=1 Tax=Spirosoma foliorum TaxID=2710596 RepID=A0A7G5GSB8_9BACT|nr:hypothetical protein [Spirosoma foliorum]QMW01760.1 hypothetical protein H3H32_28010 [Spirosoma foliorum]
MHSRLPGVFPRTAERHHIFFNATITRAGLDICGQYDPDGTVGRCRQMFIGEAHFL